MKQDQLNTAYDKFFNKSDEGKYFINYVKSIIDKSHKLSEDNPELAMAYSQKAKGARDIIQHIQSVTTVIKKGKNIL